MEKINDDIQMCCMCDKPTGRCEEIGLYADEGGGPFCEECYEKQEEYRNGEKK